MLTISRPYVFIWTGGIIVYRQVCVHNIYENEIALFSYLIKIILNVLKLKKNLVLVK